MSKPSNSCDIHGSKLGLVKTLLQVPWHCVSHQNIHANGIYQFWYIHHCTFYYIFSVYIWWMEFLVQSQIELEYEFSQVATPKTQDSMAGLSVESDSGQKGIQMLAGNFRRIDTQENWKWQLGSIVSARYEAYLSPVIEQHQFSQLSSPQSGHHELILRWRKKHDCHDVQRFGASSVQKRWKHQVG